MTDDKRPSQGTLAAEVSTLWTAHLAAPFPDGLRWVDTPSSESVPALDAYLAGCIQAFIANRGTLDPERLQVLKDCATDLAGLLGSLSGDEAVYVSRLLQAAELIAQQPQ
jgi:hypothetical protein